MKKSSRVRPVRVMRCRWCERELPPTHFAPGRKGCKTCLAGEPLPKDWAPPAWPPYATQPGAPCPLCGGPVEQTCAHHTYCSEKCRRRAERLRRITRVAARGGT